MIKKIVPKSIKAQMRKVFNLLVSDETIAESKQKWDRLAEENSRYYVMTDFGENISEEKYRETGASDITRLIDEDDLLREQLAPMDKKTMLEIGCGTGRLTEFLALRFKRVAGVDISEAMVREGVKRLENIRNVELTATDGRTLPFPDESFDFVFSFIVFQHMPDKKTVQKNLAEVARTLRNGAIAKIQLRGMPGRKGFWSYGPSFGKREVRRLLKAVPLEIIKEQGVGERYYWLWLQKR
jgi:SAM-dependent methyltransferase